MSTTPAQPEPIEKLTPMEEFLENNFKKIALGCAAVAAIAVVTGVVRYMGSVKDLEASAAFAAAKTIEDYDIVIAERSGSNAAGNAMLAKADLLWQGNKKDSSIDVLNQFLSKHSNHPLKAQAELGLASKLDSIGKKAEAKAAFEKVIASNAGTDIAAVAQLRLGDLLWAEGKEDDAKAIYESLPAKFTNASTTILDQGESRLKWISAKLPTQEVDGPPKPKEEPKPDAGAPQIKLDSGGLLRPGLSGSGAPAIQLSPSGTATPMTPTAAPQSVTTSPVEAPKPVAPAPEATKVETTAPAPKAVEKPTEAPPQTAAPKAESETPAPKAP